MKKTFFLTVTIILASVLFIGVCFANQAIIQKSVGQCEVLGKTDWIKASAGMQLTKSSRIRTGTKFSSCEILFEDGHSLRIGGNTAITLSELISNKILINLERGNVRSKVKKLSMNKYYGIKTPTAVAAVRGTDFNVAFENQMTKVEVFEGVVTAREDKTGAEVRVNAGEYTTVESGKEPAKPQSISEKSESPATHDAAKYEIKSEAQREIFLEISREAVMERAAEEIKMAEYQNGKTMVDAFGKRVRLEEYIVRPKDTTTQFKYVVLNTRDNRFDFGKILFTFDTALPSDLSLASKYMYYKEGATAPDYKLTAIDSVMSNTYDKILEEATGGSYLQGTTNLGAVKWTHYFADDKFYAGNMDTPLTENGGRGKMLYWTKTDSAGIAATKYLLPNNSTDAGWLASTTAEPTNPAVDKNLWSTVAGNTPSDSARDLYSDGTWIQNDTYIIDDNGKKITIDKTADLYKLNFEQVYNSSLFKDKIDLVFSSKLLIDSAIVKGSLK